MRFVQLLAVVASIPFVEGQMLATVSNSNFYKEDWCGERVPFDPKQAYYVTTGKGRLGCAKLCAQEEGCLSYTTSGPDCLLYPVRLQTCGSSVSHPRASYYVKRWCYNGGTLVSNKCRCPEHIRGDRCQDIMKDCNDLMIWTNTSGVYWVEPPDAPGPFQVYCQMEYGGRTYLQRHYRGGPDFSFNRTWDEYMNGFGNLSSKSFWLGLRQLYWLTALGNKVLGIQVEYSHANRANSILSLFYGEFRMRNVDTDFEMLPNTGGKWGSLSSIVNCLGTVVGSGFATFDHAQNTPTRECALRYGAGWWIDANGSSCNMLCNPNGRLRAKGESYNIGDVYFHGLNESFDIDAVYIFVEKEQLLP